MNGNENLFPISPTDGKNGNWIGDPAVAIPAVDPPVPNRAWTEMKLGKDIDELSEEEKADLYLGRDNYF